MIFLQYISNASLPVFVIIIFSLLTGCAEPAVESIPDPATKKEVEACDKDKIQHPKLLSVKQAHDFLGEPDYLYVEVSKEKEYNKGHIPNALHIWRPDFRSKQKGPITGMRCTPTEFVVFLQNLGLTERSTLVLYDAKGGSDALRLAWVFDFYGFENYKVINGGKKAWSLASYPLTKQQAVADKNLHYNFKVKENRNILATHNDVLHAIKDTNTLIIDTREHYEYHGQCFIHQDEVLAHKNGAFERGCIPTSIHLNWSTLSDLSNDHRIKCSKDLKFDLEKKRITKDKNIIVYCQSGSRSSHTAFVLKEILEYPNVKNYDGSWIEWSYLAQQNDVPVHKHTKAVDFNKEKERLNASVFKR